MSEPILLGIIGGTGLYSLSELEIVEKLNIDTPWGKPSSPITIAKTHSGFKVAFIARHGFHHQFTPTDVPSRANIAALKHIGVEVIIAFSAVGSLQQEIAPRDFVIPSQIIDRTKGLRPSSFFQSGLVAHLSFGDPFDNSLCSAIGPIVENALLNNSKNTNNSQTPKLHVASPPKNDINLVCMEGPAFSTRAESHIYRSWGGHVINMSAIPEAKLAKEAEIAYAMVCMSTDYDAWRIDAEPVTVETVVGNLQANSSNAHKVIADLITFLEPSLKSHSFGANLRGSMKFACSTSAHGVDPNLVEKLNFILPGYFSSSSASLHR